MTKEDQKNPTASAIGASTAYSGAERESFPDVLRGIAILLVILTHVGQWAPSGSLLSSTSAFGQLGVQLFFIVSGYTLTLASSKRQKWRARDYRTFFIRRWFRIAPMYYLAILGYFVVRFAAELRPSMAHGVKGLEIYSATSVLANVFFVNGFLPSAQNTIVPGGWSIGAEFFFYLCFPLILTRSRPFLVGCVLAVPALILAAAQFYIPAADPAINNSFAYFFPLVHLPCFLCGVLLFRSTDAIGRRPVSLLLAVSAAAALVGIVCLWPVGVTNNWLFLVVPTLSIAPFSWLLVFSRTHALGDSAVLRSIGERSFSMYLIHFFFVDLFSVLLRQQTPKQLTVLFGYLIVCLLSYACASVTYKYIEMPCVALGRRISNTVSGGLPALR